MNEYECRVCGEQMSAELKSCPVCGTSAEIPTGSELSPQIDNSTNLGGEHTALDDATASTNNCINACRECGVAIAVDTDDEFCACGAALPTKAERAESPSAPSSPVDTSLANRLDAASTQRPGKGAYFLTLFSKDKVPIAYFPIKGDYMLVGRSDPIRGDFPDADIGQYFDSTDSKKVSRRHLLIIRARDTQNFFVRALAKSTGTQVEKSLLEELKDHPIVPGTRIVLGGTIRMKFEYES